MFTTPCFIRKNNKALRDRLSKMGYYPFYGTDDEEDYCNLSKGLGVNHKPWGAPSFFSIHNPDYFISCGWIDCGDNEDLFFALASLRNDTDKGQWFIMDIDIYTHIGKGDWFMATDINGKYHVGTKIEPCYCHKASVEELKKHFRKSWFRRLMERIGI